MIAATGVLHHPRYPDIEGLDTFTGAMFHSARWDHDVPTRRRAGRHHRHRLDRGADRRRRSSTGSRSSRCSSARRSGSCRRRTRRTPTRRRRRSATTRRRMRDAARRTSRRCSAIFANAVVDSDSPEIKMIEQACLDNLENNVRDPELRERLRPEYRAACKRLIISPDFYDAIQQPNAELVTEAIERSRARGRAHRRTARCTSSTCSCSRPASRPTRSCGRWTSSAATASTLDEAWDRRARARTCRSRSPSSRTSSC